MFRRKAQLEIRLTNTTINPVRLILYRLFSVFTRNIQVAYQPFQFQALPLSSGAFHGKQIVIRIALLRDQRSWRRGDWRISLLID